jgi:hypothetical protein
MKNDTEERQDLYTRITAQIVAELEKGARPWLKPWNAEHAAGDAHVRKGEKGSPVYANNMTRTRGPIGASRYSYSMRRRTRSRFPRNMTSCWRTCSRSRTKSGAGWWNRCTPGFHGLSQSPATGTAPTRKRSMNSCWVFVRVTPIYLPL